MTHARYSDLLAIVALCVTALGGCKTVPTKANVWQPAPLNIERTQPGNSVCVALSGGGLRSAAFSIGVMQGLHDAKLLDQSTIMSATSGGAYAASWLYIADRLRKIGAANALDSLGAEQERLADASEFFIRRSFGAFIAAIGAPTEGLFGPLRKASCSDDQPELWPSGGSVGYGNAIKRVFYAQPNYQAKRMDRKNQGPPVGLELPIIGVSLVTGFRPSCDVDYLRTDLKAAEVVDSWVRSHDGAAYPVTGMTFRDLITSAGGAIDVPPAALRPPPVEGESASRDVFNLCKVPRTFRPLIGHAFCGRSEGRPEQVVFMTDGGFTDNLAVLPLLRRECPVTIVVDAGHDPTLDFDWQRQVGAELTAAGVDSRQIVDQIRGTDTDATARFLADKAAAMVGGHVQADGKAFWLVKLAVPDGVDSDELPTSVAQALLEASQAGFDETGCSGEGLRLRCRFPQQSTAVQNYTPEQFRAYRDLGRWAVRTELVPKLVESGVLLPKE